MFTMEHVCNFGFYTKTQVSLMEHYTLVISLDMRKKFFEEELKIIIFFQFLLTIFDKLTKFFIT